MDYTALLGRTVLSVTTDANGDVALVFTGAALTLGADGLALCVEDE